MISLLPAGLLGLAGCASGRSSYDPRQDTDAQFQKMVLRVMPDYRLTSAITGRPVVRSPGYAITGVSRKKSPETVLTEFLSQFQDSVLRSVVF